MFESCRSIDMTVSSSSPAPGHPVESPPDRRALPLGSLDWIARHTTGAMLRAGAFGLEREALRVAADRRLALTPHPPEFGDKLRNPRVTVESGAVVGGPLNFEREVDLYLGSGATVGPIEGVPPQRHALP